MWKSDYILVTGFGPFGEHKVNASWEAVSLLPDRIKNYNVIKKEIPVIYSYVEKGIPELWQKYNPKLVVHVGVASSYNEIKIETCANKQGYIKNDVSGSCPVNPLNTKTNDEQVCISTDLCAATICKHLENTLNVCVGTSEDAGRYLCEFTYYTSLNIDSQRSLFVHVPPLDKPFTKKELAEALEEIIKCSIDLVDKVCISSTIYKNGRAAAVF